MSRSMTATTITSTFPSHAQMLTIRDEAQLRKQAIMTFGHQGVLDLAVLGAILGNHIREIGRYKVTCDGQLVQGRYTIYELVHARVLFVTGRNGSNSNSNSNSSSCSSSGNNDEVSTRIYPSTLANIFPALVFKTLQKSIRPPS